MRIRAIREYVGEQSCEHTPPKTAKYYVITFVKTDGIVVAKANFSIKAEADAVVDAVNKVYDEAGPIFNHVLDWTA